MKNYRINFIRHGMTEANQRGVYVGRSDPELSPEGIRALLELKDRCLYPEVQRVYTSPLARCVQTAGVLYPDADPFIVEEMIELDFGEWDGQSFDQLKDKPEFQAWMRDAFHNAPPGGETGEEFSCRLLVGLRYIFEQMMAEGLGDVAVVTHGGAIMNLLFTMGLPRSQFGRYYAKNGEGFSVVLTPQMWMRDNAFEICGSIPVPKDYEGAEGWAEDPWNPTPLPDSGDQ